MDYAFIAASLWIIFLVVWLVSAFNTKRTAKRKIGSWILYRGLMLVVIYLLLISPATSRLVIYSFTDPALNLVGVILCALGIALAIWARFYLGRNWGGPMTEKQDAELVTSGPYRYIRHPIYTGVLVALVGSMLATGFVWGIVFIIAAVYFIHSMGVEEKIMLRLFPDSYPEYLKRTKRIIPFIY